MEFFINGTIDIPLLKKNLNFTDTKNYYNVVKNTVPILQFVYKIGVVAVKERWYSYRSSSEDKNDSKTCGSRFNSRKMWVPVLG